MNTHSKIRSVTFDDFTHPEEAYILGLLQTDGNQNGNPQGRGKITIEIKREDDSVLYQISNMLGCYSSIALRSRDTSFKKGYESTTLSFFDQLTRKKLAAAGLTAGRKSRTIEPPSFPFSEPDYVRGILDGDGSVGFTRTGAPFVSFVTVSSAMASYFQDVILRITGVSRNSNPNARDGAYNIMVTNQAAAVLAGWVWNPDSSLGIERKRNEGRKVAQWTVPPEKRGRYGVERHTWTKEEDQVVMNLSPKESSKVLGRTMKSISIRRWRLSHQ